MMISILVFVNGKTGRSVPVLNEDGNIISDIRHGKGVDLASGSEVFFFK
jgi:hypothetical protein